MPINTFRSWINSPLLELYYAGWNWKKAYSPSVSYIEKEAFLKLNGFSMWYHPLERHRKLDFSRINRVHKNKSWLKIERNTMVMACTGNEFIFHVNSNSVLIELEKNYVNYWLWWVLSRMWFLNLTLQSEFPKLTIT